MKKAKKTAILIGLFLSSVCFAVTEDEKLQIKRDMQSFSNGLEMVQRGIIYNNNETVRLGIKQLKKGSEGLMTKHGESIKHYMPQNPMFAYEFSRSAAKKIDDYVNKLEASLSDSREYGKTSALYTHIFNECVGCHQKIRRW